MGHAHLGLHTGSTRGLRAARGGGRDGGLHVC